MALKSRPPKRDWTSLLINSGLAASIGAAGSLLTDRLKADDSVDVHRCEIAKDFLSVAKPVPYIFKAQQAGLARGAATTLARCLEER